MSNIFKELGFKNRNGSVSSPNAEKLGGRTLNQILSDLSTGNPELILDEDIDGAVIIEGSVLKHGKVNITAIAAGHNGYGRSDIQEVLNPDDMTNYGSWYAYPTASWIDLTLENDSKLSRILVRRSLTNHALHGYNNCSISGKEEDGTYTVLATGLTETIVGDERYLILDSIDTTGYDVIRLEDIGNKYLHVGYLEAIGYEDTIVIDQEVDQPNWNAYQVITKKLDSGEGNRKVKKVVFESHGAVHTAMCVRFMDGSNVIDVTNNTVNESASASFENLEIVTDVPGYDYRYNIGNAFDTSKDFHNPVAENKDYYASLNTNVTVTTVVTFSTPVDMSEIKINMSPDLSSTRNTDHVVKVYDYDGTLVETFVLTSNGTSNYIESQPFTLRTPSTIRVNGQLQLADPEGTADVKKPLHSLNSTPVSIKFESDKELTRNFGFRGDVVAWGEIPASGFAYIAGTHDVGESISTNLFLLSVENGLFNIRTESGSSAEDHLYPTTIPAPSGVFSYEVIVDDTTITVKIDDVIEIIENVEWESTSKNVEVNGVTSYPSHSMNGTTENFEFFNIEKYEAFRIQNVNTNKLELVLDGEVEEVRLNLWIEG